MRHWLSSVGRTYHQERIALHRGARPSHRGVPGIQALACPVCLACLLKKRKVPCLQKTAHGRNACIAYGRIKCLCLQRCKHAKPRQGRLLRGEGPVREPMTGQHARLLAEQDGRSCLPAECAGASRLLWFHPSTLLATAGWSWGLHGVCNAGSSGPPTWRAARKWMYCSCYGPFVSQSVLPPSFGHGILPRSPPVGQLLDPKGLLGDRVCAVWVRRRRL